MKNPMRKRLPRELRQDLGKYIVLFLFLGMMISLCSGFLVADLSMTRAYEESFEKYKIEDGHFELDTRASDELLGMLEEEEVTIYPLFYHDKVFQGGRTLRIFQTREQINLADVMEGELPKAEDEVALDRLFALNNGVSVGDTVQAGKEEYRVTGMVALSDYSAMFQNNADTMFDATQFGVGVMTEEGHHNLGKAGEHYRYAWVNDRELTAKQNQDKMEDLMDIINENAEKEFDKQWLQHPGILLETGLSMLTEGELDVSLVGVPSLNDMVTREDNQAIMFTGDDIGRDRVMILILLYILITILSFVFAVTTRSTLEQEAGTIGTLLASGYRRAELIRHYLILPTLVMLLAAVAGNIMGYTYFKRVMANLYYNSYSLPTYQTIWNADAFWLTTLIPCALLTVINLLVLVWTLRLPPLKFLRHELKTRKAGRTIRLPNFPFLTRFRIRVILQNRTSFLILAVGVMLSSLLLLFGLALAPLLEHASEAISSSQIAKYQYILKAPVVAKQEGAEKYWLNTLEQENDYITEDIMVYGIVDHSRYLSEVELPEGENEVIASSNYLKKYKYSVGDSITLKKPYSTDTCTFQIAGSYAYEAGLTLFMRQEQFCSTFDVDRSEFTGYFSDEELDINEKVVASIITSADLLKVSNQLKDSMGDMFEFIKVFAIILYLLLIYLLARMIIEKNRDSISMLKILGYSDREAGSIYNSATFIVVVLSLLISVPVVIRVLDVIWDLYLIRMHGWLDYYVAPWIPYAIFGAGLVSYLVISRVLLLRIRKIPLSAALKNME